MIEFAMGTFIIPLYEEWEWKPKKGEFVMVSMDGKKWSAQFFYEYDDEYPDGPYQCAHTIKVGGSKTYFYDIFSWKYIAKLEDILNAKSDIENSKGKKETAELQDMEV